MKTHKTAHLCALLKNIYILQQSLKNTNAWTSFYNNIKICRDGSQFLGVCLKSFPGDFDRQPELRITDKELYTYIHMLYRTLKSKSCLYLILSNPVQYGN